MLTFNPFIDFKYGTIVLVGTSLPEKVSFIFQRTIGESEGNYRNDPKFSDRYVWAKSADPDQTAPRGAV